MYCLIIVAELKNYDSTKIKKNCDNFTLLENIKDCSNMVSPGPILEFKGSVRRVQKGHPTLVPKVDLILQN